MNERMSYHPYQGKRRLNWRVIAIAVAVALVLCLLAPFIAVLAGSHSEWNGNPQVMVVFGCQVKPDGPSILLRDRLDAALGYLTDHPDMTVVVTGGKGSDEHQSEAQAMYDYLTAGGVDGEHILMEDQSRNTAQNIAYTRNLLSANGFDPNADVLLVSNGFHLTRIRMLWERSGAAGQVSTLAAPASHIPTRIWMHVREPLALVKSFFLD